MMWSPRFLWLGREQKHFVISYGAWDKHWRLQIKIVSLVLLVAFASAAALTVFNGLSLTASTSEATGMELLSKSAALSRSMSDRMTGAVEALEVLALSPAIVEAADSAGQEGAADVSAYLASFVESAHGQADVVVTDASGVVVGSSAGTVGLSLAGDAWWNAAFDGGRGALYAGDLASNASGSEWTMRLAAPIRSATGDVVGVLGSKVQVTLMCATLMESELARFDHVALMDGQGNVLLCQGAGKDFLSASDDILMLLRAREPQWAEDITGMAGEPAVVAVQPLHDDLLGALGWTLLIEKMASGIVQRVWKSMIEGLWAPALVTVIMALGSLWAGWMVASPLRLMQHTAENLALGNLNRDADGMQKGRIADRTDEIGLAGQGLMAVEAYMRDMSHVADRIAAGDLSVEVTPRSTQDELGTAFAAMVQSLRTLIGRLQETAGQVAGASELIRGAAEHSAEDTGQVAQAVSQVAQGTGRQSSAMTDADALMKEVEASIEEISRGATEQSEVVEMLAANVSEMSATIMGVAENARESAAASTEVTRIAEAGFRTVHRAIEVMGITRDMVTDVGARVEQMQMHSAEIGTITGMIDDLAEQTNLLALNAAIEAARAGVHGRGFAVVADEVRKLAESSRSAAQDIAQLITAVQEDTQETVEAVATSLQQTEDGVAKATEAGGALEEILGAATRAVNQVNEIGAAVDGMRGVADRLLGGVGRVASVVEQNTQSTRQLGSSNASISAAMEGVATICGENGASAEEISATAKDVSAQVEEMAASARRLAAVAAEMQSVAARFRLPDGAGRGRLAQVLRDDPRDIESHTKGHTIVERV